jgi:hypothetical protein
MVDGDGVGATSSGRRSTGAASARAAKTSVMGQRGDSASLSFSMWE